MTPKERAAMQQALEALEEYRDTQMIKAPRKAISSLREALAEQAEQEPVTISCECGDIYERNSFGGRFIKLHGICPNCDAALQAAPVRTKDLTDADLLIIRDEYGLSWEVLDFARAVIAADREKNCA